MEAIGTLWPTFSLGKYLSWVVTRYGCVLGNLDLPFDTTRLDQIFVALAKYAQRCLQDRHHHPLSYVAAPFPNCLKGRKRMRYR